MLQVIAITGMGDHHRPDQPIAITGIRRDRKAALVRDPSTGRVQEVQAEDLPADLHRLLGAYLAELPGYDLTRPFEKQPTRRPEEMHGFALFFLHLACVPPAPTSRAA